MKKLTIFDIAKILKFDVNQTNDLKKDFENADSESKVEIMDTMWNAFFDLFKKISELKYNQLLVEVSQGKGELKTDLYLQAKKLTLKYLEDILYGTPQEIRQVDEIRNKLKSLIQN